MARRRQLVPPGQLQHMLERFGDQTRRELEREGMERLALALEAKAVELAPVDQGDLQASSSSTVQRRGGSMVVGVVRFSAPHAAAAHELPEHARGPGTRAKPGNEYGAAGPKFLERPLRGFQQRMTRDLGKLLQEVWGRAQRRGGRGAR